MMTPRYYPCLQAGYHQQASHGSHKHEATRAVQVDSAPIDDVTAADTLNVFAGSRDTTANITPASHPATIVVPAGVQWSPESLAAAFTMLVVLAMRNGALPRAPRGISTSTAPTQRRRAGWGRTLVFLQLPAIVTGTMSHACLPPARATILCFLIPFPPFVSVSTILRPYCNMLTTMLRVPPTACKVNVRSHQTVLAITLCSL